MSLPDAIKTILHDAGGVGGIVGDGIFPAVVPDGHALPALVYQVISGEAFGSLNAAGDLKSARVQVTSWAATHAGAWTLAAAVLAAMDAYTGVPAGVTIQWIAAEEPGADMPSYAPENEAARAWGVRQDFLVWYKG